MVKGHTTEYYDKFHRKWTIIENYVDVETGELITKSEYYENYKRIRTEEQRKYGKEYGYKYKTHIGRWKAKQGSLW